MSQTDEEITEEAISEPWRHASMHAFNVDEHDDIWERLNSLETQVDELHSLVIRLASALNTLLPVPISLDER